MGKRILCAKMERIVVPFVLGKKKIVRNGRNGIRFVRCENNVSLQVSKRSEAQNVYRNHKNINIRSLQNSLQKLLSCKDERYSNFQ